jgi:S-adenosylmethionine hydrolase
MQLPRPSGVVTLLTDFGALDPYAGVMRGAVLRAMPRANVVDLCHEVPPQDVALGALFLGSAVRRFPSGTVHVAVVDPGVGTARRVLCACAAECFWLAPDNGLLSGVLAAAGESEVRAVDTNALGLVPSGRTFHGRDVFAPLAGWLANGRYGFQALGPRCTDPHRAEDLREGPPRVIHVDRYGNLITNLGAGAIAGAAAVRIGGTRVPVAATYGDTRKDALVAVVNSYELVEIAANLGNAACVLDVGVGAPVAVDPTP